MKRDLGLEASLVEKYAAIEPVLNERGRRLWAAAESRAIGYGGDSVVSSETGLSRITIRAGRREIEAGADIDTLVVADDRGVLINLAQANAEVVFGYGGDVPTGDDSVNNIRYVV